MANGGIALLRSVEADFWEETLEESLQAAGRGSEPPAEESGHLVAAALPISPKVPTSTAIRCAIISCN